MDKPKMFLRYLWYLVATGAVLRFGLLALSFVTVVCVIVPFSPTMPWVGLDPSWQFGLNQAVAQRMMFGHDIVFTYGPYASLYTKLYHPAVDHLMIFCGVYFALIYGLALLLLIRESPTTLLLAYSIVMAGLMFSLAAVYFAYPLLVALCCFRFVYVSHEPWLTKSRCLTVIFLLFSALALMALIKGSFLAFCVVVTLSATGLFLLHKKWVWALIAIVSVVTSVLFFWSASGQSITNIPAYLLSMSPVISGYSAGMSLPGANQEIVFFVIVASLLLLLLSRVESDTLLQRGYTVGLFAVYLLLAFKSGFVRHDNHAVAAGTSLLLASLLVAMLYHSRAAFVVLGLSFLVLVNITSHTQTYSIMSVFDNIKSTYLSAWQGAQKRYQYDGLLEKRFTKRLEHLKAVSAFPLFSGTTDIYSFNQSGLIASGNRWNPRPAFQSYIAYTPELVRKNSDHLWGNNAPDNIIFGVEPIDKHMPSTEDGLSWLAILQRYTPSALAKNFLYLHLREDSSSNSNALTFLSDGSYRFGETVHIPNHESFLFAEISIKKSIAGKFASFLFKSSPLEITLVLESGASTAYRIVPGMVETGFLLSPLIQDTLQFSRLFGNIDALSEKSVRSFSIAPSAAAGLWNNRFEVVFKRAIGPPAMDISTLYSFAADVGDLNGLAASPAQKCDGGIDSINGTAPVPERVSATNILALQGWLATSAAQGLLPDAVFVVLQDQGGARTFFATQKAAHPWAVRHFDRPELEFSGYKSLIDVSHLVGEYTLSVAFLKDNQLKLCPQTPIPLTLTGVPF